MEEQERLELLKTPMTETVKNLTLGSDPEVFIKDPTGTIYPILDLIGGTKDKPRPLAVEGFFVQEDNVLAEFNIPPSKTKEAFVANIHLGLELLGKALPYGFEPIVQASHHFSEEMLLDPRAQEFGCDPDYNAWSLEKNAAPDAQQDPTLRSAGGHVILGYDNPHPMTNAKLVRYFDAYLGVPSILLDLDSNRRKLYGKAGAYRDKPFGVEYRTLSSAWLRDKKFTGWIWDQVMKAVDHFNSGDELIISHDRYIIATINTGNVRAAERFVENFKIALP